jgi:hydrogenase expression/formation protein HypD
MMTQTFNNQVFRDPKLVHQLVKKINHLADSVADKLKRPIQVMEVCGGHTHAIFHSGIDQLLNQNIEFIHGPGCPVCVLPAEAIDKAAALAHMPNTILASFGDVLRVPGSLGSLQQSMAKGADIRVLYSPYDVIELAQANPDKQVCFFAIGFDTTMPSIALTIQATKLQKVSNLKFLCYHIRLMPTLLALLDMGEVKLDGFIGPGHVSIVLGSKVYAPIAEKYHKPLVIAGFEPVDLLHALLMLLEQLNQQRCEIENAYGRVVSEHGNATAQGTMIAVFKNSELNWRGIGKVANSVVSLNPEYAMYDASTQLTHEHNTDNGDSPYCAEVLIGKRKPDQCPHFRQDCHPESPLGALMVSSEGACAAYFKYKQGNNRPALGGEHVDA